MINHIRILTGILFSSMISGHIAGQVICAPTPEPGSTIEVNVNAFSTFNLRCINVKKDAADSLVAHNINEIAHWRLNGKEIQPGVGTPLGTILLTGDKKTILYKAPLKKPAGNTVTFTAEYTHNGRNNSNKKYIYFWTIKIKDNTLTEVHLEDADAVMKVKTELKEGYDISKNMSQYENRLSPEARAKLEQVKSQRPEMLNMGKYQSNARATFLQDDKGHHFVITISDPKDPAAGSLNFELPDSLMKSYETNSTDCKAGITYGVTNCKIRVQTKGYVNESSDGKGNTISGLLRITLTEVGQPGGYVKGTFTGTLATYAKECSTEGGHSHPIELREAYGSFVAVRQVNVIR